MGIERFLEAQKRDYDQALREIRAGRKTSHWMWYIFPQLKGLGFSEMAQYYGIRDMEEARAYIAEPTLRSRLIEISGALASLPESDPRKVMGYPDDLKLFSSMTLFAITDPEIKVFQEVLKKFYQGRYDQNTMDLLQPLNK